MYHAAWKSCRSTTRAKRAHGPAFKPKQIFASKASSAHMELVPINGNHKVEVLHWSSHGAQHLLARYSRHRILLVDSEEAKQSDDFVVNEVNARRKCDLLECVWVDTCRV